MQTRKVLESIKPYIAGTLKPGAIKLASNENPLGASPLAVEAVRESLSRVHLYPDALADRLREKLAEKRGIEPNQIIVGNGSDEVILFIAGAVIESGTNAVTSHTTFSEYTFAVTLFGGSMKYAPLADGRFDLAALRGLIDKNTRVVFLCNPNNPTGTYFTSDELETFLDKVPSDVLVVLDEAYHEYVRASDYPDAVTLIGRYPNLMVLRTFSKIYGLAGLRVGYGISSEAVISALRKTKEPFNVNLIGQTAALAALDDAAFVSRSIEVNEEGKAYLYRAFDELGLEYYRTEANFVCVKLGIDANTAFKRIMELGVTIRPLGSFGLHDTIRVTVGTADQNRMFVSCLTKLLTEHNAVPSS
jgi:histidinol-phosphate aminotransferase